MNATKTKCGNKVVTWYSPECQASIAICPACEAAMRAQRIWPHAGNQEYCQVMVGLHRGECEIEADLSAEWIY